MEKVILGKYKGIHVSKGLTDKEKEEYILDEILSHSTVKVPEREISDRAKRMVEEYALRLTQQGLSIEHFYTFAKTDEKTLVNAMKVLAKKQLKSRMILEAIARKEGITATEEDYDAEIEKLTERYPLDKKEILKIMQGEEEKRLRDEIVVKKARDFVMEHAAE